MSACDGAGTPLVLLPGMMCDERLFGPQVEAIGRERPVIVARIDQEQTVEEMAASVLRQAPARFALAGLSLGGIVAMAVVAMAAGRVERLALLDTNPLAERPDVAARREPQIEAVRRGQLAVVMSEQMIPNYCGASGPDDEISSVCLAMAMALGPDTFIRQSRALQARPDRTATLESVTVPTLILTGSHDRLCPMDRHELMAGLVPDALLAVIDDAGHLPTLQNPCQTTLRLQQWLSSRSTSHPAPAEPRR